MIRKIIIVLIIVFANFFSKAQLTDQAKIYVLTCSPGEELYQTFGHSAIRVVDPVLRIDYVFNYGTFDFYEPHFYLHFIQGKLNYMLELEPTRYFIDEYKEAKRDVWASELNLTNEEKNKIYNFLMWNSLPENKYYLYDFFLDNCATRVIGALEKGLPAKSLIYPDLKINKTYRQAIKPYLIDRPWTRFGMNLLLGLPADKKLDIRTSLFLPDYVDTITQQMQIVTDTGTKPFVKQRKIFIESHFEFKPKPWFNPTLVFVVLALIFTYLFFYERKRQKLFITADFILWIVIGIVSFVMLFMWFGTDHSPTKWNLNLIWAFPLHFVYAFYLKRNHKSNFVKYYSLVFSVVYLVLILTFPFFPQQFDTAMLPLLYILGTRMYNEFYFSKK